MRKEFLRSVAERFYSVSGGDLKDYCFVFPNRRSALFFRRYLGECAGKPVFAPRITNVSDLFSGLSSLRLLDRITLLHRLFVVFQDKVEDFSESFDDFIYRGEVILNDFDDIDKYMADARGLFANIKDIREIDSRYEYLSVRQREAIASFWGVVIPYRDGRKETQFLGMWERMYEVYQAFRERLASAGEAYEGMIYRNVAEDLACGNHENLGVLDKYVRVVFVGLNAPNRCEKQLFDTLARSGKGDFYWDYYGEAIRDSSNKSSLLMKENVAAYPSMYPLPEDGGLCSEPPHITAVSVPSSAGQAKYVNRILKEIVKSSGNTDLFSTAVLLPDEQLLFPLLNSLPEEVSPVNVTMGYSLAHSNVSSFISAVSSMQERSRVRDGSVRFYFRDVLDVLSHPYVANLAPGPSAALKERIAAENMIYLPVSAFEGDSFMETLFRDAAGTDTDGVTGCLSDYLKEVLDAVSPGADRIDREFFLGYYRSLNLLRSLGIKMRKDTYFRLLRRVVSSVSIPFSGEPLDGLQIMGPLEIRALDFENLIILSVNEGVFPSKNTAPSMIPYNLRRGFGLPTYEYQDSVSAYHFYRSICRARNVWLIYDSRGDGLKSGEESRYIKQLEYHFGYDVRRMSVSFGVSGGTVNELHPVPKTQEHVRILSEMTFSNSSLQTWLSCPMRFYYRYILGLPESRDLAEGLDTAAFGTLYHYVMRRLYLPFTGRKADAVELERLAADEEYLRRLVGEGFSEELKISEVTGRNLIAGALVEKIAAQTLRVDASSAPFTVIALERPETVRFVTGTGTGVRIKGIYDRIDRTSSGQTRILDYKTGGDHFMCRDISGLFDPETASKGSHVFQLYLYLLILDLCGKAGKDVENDMLLEIYYTKNIYGGVRTFRVPSEEEYRDFRSGLSVLIDNILDPEVPFTACKDERTCGYCPYKSECRR